MCVTEYKCPCCGAALQFGAEEQQMRCEYCENTFTLEALEACQASAKAEPDTFDWTNDSRAWTQADQESMQAFHCPSCGGEILTEATTAATFCPYCGSPAILPGRVSDSLRPDRIIPFQLRREEAQEAFQRFCHGKRLLPKHYVTTQQLEKITGMYVPFWIFDGGVDATARYRATRIHHWADSKYSYTRTDHFLLQRGGNLQCRGVPVDGSRNMDNTWMEAIEPYDYSQAVPFDMAYLSGYLADKYDVSSQECQPIANARIRATAEARLADTTPGFATIVPEHKSVQVHGGQVQYMLLPVWVLHSAYQGKRYTFMMNGQTGKLVGELPISKSRSWAWFGAVCGGVTAAAHPGWSPVPASIKEGIGMKRWISLFLLLILLASALPVVSSAALPLVIDEANLLSARQTQSLADQAAAIRDRYQMDVVILTVFSLNGKDPEAYADDYYDEMGYGMGSDHSGILLLISMENRDWAISTCGEAITWVTDQDLARLEDALLPSLAQDSYSTAFQNYLRTLDRILDAPLPEESGFSWNRLLLTLLVSLLLGGLAGGMVLLVLRRQMHTARPQRYAGDYVVPNSFQLTLQRDIYLYSRTSRVKRQTSEHSGNYHGGSSSTHRSSGGARHGGSHGKF